MPYKPRPTPQPYSASDLLAEAKALGGLGDSFVEIGGKVYLRDDCMHCEQCGEPLTGIDDTCEPGEYGITLCLECV